MSTPNIEAIRDKVDNYFAYEHGPDAESVLAEIAKLLAAAPPPASTPANPPKEGRAYAKTIAMRVWEEVMLPNHGDKTLPQILRLLIEIIEPTLAQPSCVPNIDTQRDAFKDFVHRRLDAAGVPKEFPNGKHTKEGCRVGDRLDWVLDRPDVAKLAAACELALLWHAGRWTDRERDKWDEHMAVIMAQSQVPDGVWQGVAATAKNLCDAIRAALAAVNVNWRAPVPELEGSFPLVLYFANEADRDEAIAVVKADRPNMKAVPL